MSERKHFPRIHRSNGLVVVSMGSMHMWDLADIQSLRETLKRLVSSGNCNDVGIDMRHVRSLAPGFFGALYDMKERGLGVWIISPQPVIREMLWFRVFCEPVSEDRFILLADPKEEIIRAHHLNWNSDTRRADSCKPLFADCGTKLESKTDRPFNQKVACDPAHSIARLDRLQAHRSFDHHGDVVGIRLSACPIDDADMALISALKTIRRLLLDNTRITDRALLEISDLTALRRLNLLGTSITDTGLKYLQSLSSLEDLNLSRTRITDSGLQYLNGMERLAHLALYETAISDQGLADLTRLTRLKQLWIGKTKITPVGREQLQKALPNCNIF